MHLGEKTMQTIVLAVVFLLLVIVTMAASGEVENKEPAILISTAVAVIPIYATLRWLPGLKDQYDAYQTRSNMNDANKAKRAPSQSDDRIALLLELMTDDEKAAFKQSLQRQVMAEYRLSDDGEFMIDADEMGYDIVGR